MAQDDLASDGGGDSTGFEGRFGFADGTFVGVGVVGADPGEGGAGGGVVGGDQAGFSVRLMRERSWSCSAVRGCVSGVAVGAVVVVVMGQW